MDNITYVYIAIRSICEVILLGFLTIELRQIRKAKSYYDYFSSGWNLFEIGLQFAYLTYLIISFVD